MRTLQALVTQQVGQTVRQYVEVYRAVVMIQEVSVVERGRFASLLQVIFVAFDTIQDQVGQDSLLLLPPGFAVVPYKAELLFAFGLSALNHVVPTATLLVATGGRHQFGDLASQLHIAVLRFEALHAHQVPGDLQVVADYGSVLLPTPGPVRAPILVEAFLNEGAVIV